MQTHWLDRVYFQTPSDSPDDGAPYKWQAEFHAAGRKHRERALLAANRIGKTRSVSAEIAMHATGLYPDWWDGRVFKNAPRILVAGTTNEDTRNIQQTQLFGRVKNRAPDGTGWIPKERISDWSFRQCGVTSVIDYVMVQHVSGELSVINMKSYEQGAAKFQGTEYDVCWMDEEPENDDGIFSEIQTRLTTTRGSLIFTRTPLLGFTPIVRYFWNETAGSYVMTKGWKDAPHWSPEDIEEETKRCPEYLRDARSKGIPQLGSGAIFPVSDEQVTWHDPHEIPTHWARGIGIDFGIDHPAAVVCVAHDRDTDTVYVYDLWRKSDANSDEHATLIRGKAMGWIPVFYPHDGDTREKGSGMRLIETYRDVCPTIFGYPATWDDTKRDNAVEPGIQEMLRRMQEMRLLVHPQLREWFNEKAMYHRDEGKIVKKDDDLMDATRMVIMMLRHMRCAVETRVRPSFARDALEYDPLGEFV